MSSQVKRLSVLPLKITLETAGWDSVSRVARLSVPVGARVAAHAESQGACPLGNEPASQFQAQCWTPGPCWELPCRSSLGAATSFTVWDKGRSGEVASQKRKPTSGPKLPWYPCTACDSGSTGRGFLSCKERQVAHPSPRSISRRPQCQRASGQLSMAAGHSSLRCAVRAAAP